MHANSVVFCGHLETTQLRMHGGHRELLLVFSASGPIKHRSACVVRKPDLLKILIKPDGTPHLRAGDLVSATCTNVCEEPMSGATQNYVDVLCRISSAAAATPAVAAAQPAPAPARPGAATAPVQRAPAAAVRAPYQDDLDDDIPF